MDEIIALTLNEKSKNPIHILEKMMSMDFCHMHGPEHHVMVGASLEKLGVEMELDEIKCSRFKLNNQCIEERCPFYVKN